MVLGALAADGNTYAGGTDADEAFTTPERADEHDGADDLVMVTEAPFGRGVVEILGDSDINSGAEHEFVRFGGIFRQVMETLTLDNQSG